MATYSTVPLFFATLLFLLSLNNHGTEGNPTGAPTQACSDMTPGHGFQAQNGTCPYVTIPTHIVEDNTVRITLISPEPFKGYLVMAFDSSKPDSNVPIGTFVNSAADIDLPEVTDGNYLDCSSRSMSAATHKSSDDKYLVNLKWIPPAGFDGNVEFKTTFVKVIDTYWVKQPAIQSIYIVTPPSSSGRLLIFQWNLGLFVLLITWILY